MTDEKRLWIVEFGEAFGVPAEVDELVESGVLGDQSWHHDICPSFTCTTKDGWTITLYVEHVNRWDRKYINKQTLWRLGKYTEDDQSCVYEGDDLTECLAALKKEREVRGG